MRIKKNINQRIGDEYQILRTNVSRIVWQTVRRMTRDLGVERINHFMYLFFIENNEALSGWKNKRIL